MPNYLTFLLMLKYQTGKDNALLTSIPLHDSFSIYKTVISQETTPTCS